MIVEELKKSILLSALQGKLTYRDKNDTDVNKTLLEIEEEKYIFEMP